MRSSLYAQPVGTISYLEQEMSAALAAPQELPGRRAGEQHRGDRERRGHQPATAAIRLISRKPASWSTAAISSITVAAGDPRSLPRNPG